MSRMPLDERRAQLLDLGVHIFGSGKAYDAISIDEIAERAKISKGLLYHYFPTKRDFYVATMRMQARHMSERTRIGAALPGPDRLRADLESYLKYVDEHAKAYASLLRSGVGADDEVRAIVEESRAEASARIVRSLGIRKPTARVRTALRGWIGFLEGVCLDWIDHRDLAKGDIAKIALRALTSVLELPSLPPPPSAAKPRPRQKRAR